MKELVATAHNLFYTRNADGKFEPSIELILIMSEPEYLVIDKSESIKLKQRRITETSRVVCSPGALGLLMKTAIDAMEEIKKQAETADENAA